MNLPDRLYFAEQTRELDRIAIEKHGIPGFTLMQRAGQAAFAVVRSRWPQARRIIFVCGPGNNGGDGYVIARLAGEAGLEPVVMAPSDSGRLRGDALKAYEALVASGVSVQPFHPETLAGGDVIVDALFGTGLEREVRDTWRMAIDAMNAAVGVPRLAVDIPSGLHADGGRVLGVAVRAQATITFIGLKAGLFTGHGRDCCGEILFDDLGVPAEVYRGVRPAARRITPNLLAGLLARRARSLHKGALGHVAVVGGGAGMPGAARLAGQAAYRAGAGLVTLATHPTHAAEINSGCPELLVCAVSEARGLRSAIQRASVLAIGPGLGQGRWGRELLSAALEARLPKVIDADALNLLAAEPVQCEDWVLTPHPGEAGRLLGITTAAVQAQRFDALRALVERYGGVCVLKGSGTLIGDASEGSTWLCDGGNPGMASGGMGDVLTGVIAALMAQGLRPGDAARLGVWVHAAAGDDAARRGGEIGLMASDLMTFVRGRLNELADYET